MTDDQKEVKEGEFDSERQYYSHSQTVSLSCPTFVDPHDNQISFITQPSPYTKVCVLFVDSQINRKKLFS